MITLKRLLIIICMNMTLYTNLYTKNSFYITSAEESSVNTVVFDVGDVLFETSNSAKAWLLAPSLVNPFNLWSALSYKFAIRQALFETLHKVPAQADEKVAIYNQNERAPQIMVDWMTLPNQSSVVRQIAIDHVQNSDHSTGMKTLLSKIITFMFNPEELINAQSRIEVMHDLAYALKNKGYKLYVLSNWSQDSFPLLKKNNPELFAIFDGIMVSGDEGLAKPDPALYQRLLQTYNLEANNCVFIDDEPHNITAAQELGFHTALRDSNASVCAKLQELGILQHTT